MEAKQARAPAVIAFLGPSWIRMATLMTLKAVRACRHMCLQTHADTCACSTHRCSHLAMLLPVQTKHAPYCVLWHDPVCCFWLQTLTVHAAPAAAAQPAAAAAQTKASHTATRQSQTPRPYQIGSLPWTHTYKASHPPTPSVQPRLPKPRTVAWWQVKVQSSC